MESSSKDVSSVDHWDNGNLVSYDVSSLNKSVQAQYNLSFLFNEATAPESVIGNTSEVANEMGLPEESQVILILIYTAATILSVVGNALVILVFSLGRRSRTDLRAFLINLACADLIMAVFCMPFTFTMTMLGNWVFSAPMCPIVLYMQTVSVTASVCTNMAIGIDRYWVVTFPLKSRITSSRSKVVIAVIWIVALSLSSIQLFVGKSNRHEISPGHWVADCEEVWPEPSDTYRRIYTFFLLTITYIFPLTILSLTYGFICYRLWQRTAPGNADEARDAQQLKSKRKVIKMLLVIVALFGICWLPLHVFIVVLDLAPGLVQRASHNPYLQQLFIAIYYTVHWLAMSNSFVNPIIYSFLNESFRQDLKCLWRTWFPCCSWSRCFQDTSHNNSVVRAYSRYGNRHDFHSSSGGGLQEGDHHGSRKHLTVKINGTGKCSTGLSAQMTMLNSNPSSRSHQHTGVVQNFCI